MRAGVLAVAVMMLCLSVAGAAESSNPDEISKEDQKILLDFTHMSATSDCAPTCIIPGGIDWDAKTVKVTDADVALRDEWVSDYLKTDDYKRFVKFCELTTPPKIQIDVALAKMVRSRAVLFNNPMQMPDDGTFSRACNTGSDSKTGPWKKFFQKVKVIRVGLAHPWPKDKNGNYTSFLGQPTSNQALKYHFDAKSGVLTIGVHNAATNVEDTFLEWFAKTM